MKVRAIEGPHPRANLERRLIAGRHIRGTRYIRIGHHVKIIQTVVVPLVHSHRVGIHLRRESGTVALGRRDGSRRRRRGRLQDDPLGRIARGLEAVNRAPGNVQPLTPGEREIALIQAKMGAAVDHDDGLVRLLMHMRGTVIVGFDVFDAALEQTTRVFRGEHGRDGRQRKSQVKTHAIQRPHPRLRVGFRVVACYTGRAFLGRDRQRNNYNITK